ncbi:MAG: P-loop NTPase [Haloarculaceae archaeon]
MDGNYVLTVAGSKGGVGKTTTSINLAAFFADSGYETVVVEVDLAMANLVDFVTLEMDPAEEATLDDVLADGVPVLDAVYDVGDRLSVVPSSPDLDRYGDVDVSRLERALEQLSWYYDIIVFDTPAGAGEEVSTPVGLADEALLVSTPRVSSVHNTRNTKAIVQAAGTDLCGLVLTKSGTGASPGAERVAEFLDLDLLGHVPEDDAIPFSQDRGKPVVAHAPRSGAAIAYRKIAAQLVESVETRTDREPETDVVTDKTDDATDDRQQMAVANPDGDPSRATDRGEPSATAGQGPEAAEAAVTGSESLYRSGRDPSGSDRSDTDSSEADASPEGETHTENSVSGGGDDDSIGDSTTGDQSASDDSAGNDARGGTRSDDDVGGDGEESLFDRIRSGLGM